VLILVAAAVGASGAWRRDPLLTAAPEASGAQRAPEPAPLRVLVKTARLVRNETMGQALTRLGVDLAQTNAIVTALANHFPFRRAKPGDQLRVETVDGRPELRRFTYRQGPADEWVVEPDGSGALRAAKREVQLERSVTLVAVDVKGSVYEALARAGEDPALAVAAADVLAWDVDFYQDVRAGDRLRVLVEKITADGKLLRYGEVLAAEYDGAETGRKRLFRYSDPQGRTSYYDDNGNSARRGFLRSPMRYANVSSGFGNRRHPVLGYRKQHQGVDYAAPTGTPVWSVGDGTVSVAGWLGGCGKTVAVKHHSGLETVYCHLSSIAVRVGARVSQQQVVGAVGMTGIATGPHLHFAVKRAGAFLNPLGLKVPRDMPIDPRHRADFEAKLAPMRAALAGAIAVL
jgi:murein DD-endopeptidase MepM/ murein hydrolase activator NlpD